MAKNKNIEDTLNEILSVHRLKEISKEVTKEVGKKAIDDLRDEAKRIVKHYYDSYDPEVYERIYSLYKSFYYYNVTRGNTVRAGIVFDEIRIDGKHESSSDYHKSGYKWIPIDWINGGPEKNKQYGAVQSSYIMDNFWEGIHPRYKWDDKKGYVENHKRDQDSPASLLEKFIDSYESKAGEYACEVFTRKILEYLKK